MNHRRAIISVLFLTLTTCLLSCSKAYPDASLLNLLLLNEDAVATATTYTTPSVSSVTPADGTTDVSVLGTTITVTFSEEMDPATVTAQATAGTCSETIRLSTDNFSTCANITLSTTDNISFSFTPTITQPTAGLNARIMVTTGAESANGVALDGQWVSTSGITLFSPADIAGLSVWLHADSFSGLSDMDSISSWSDSSGQGNTAFQVTAPNRPLYRDTIGPNNMPWVEFQSASSHYFDMAEFMTFSTPTLIIVGRSGGGGSEYFFNDWGGGAGNALFGLRSDGDTTRPYITDDAVVALYGGTVGLATLGGWSILTLRLSNTEATYHLDGTLTGGTVPVGAYNTATTWELAPGGSAPRIGAHGQLLAGFYLNGGIAEIIMYNVAINDTERARVECYLSRKYSITGPGC